MKEKKVFQLNGFLAVLLIIVLLGLAVFMFFKENLVLAIYLY